MKTRNIRCSCGRTIRCRPNKNGVVLCPGCRSAHTPGEFVRRTASGRSENGPREEIVHDFTRRKES